MNEKDEKNQGKINLTESCRYEGAILNGLPHGQGKLSYGDNYEIEGDFEKGFLKHGMIKDHKKNETYLGEFKRKSSLNKLPMPHGNGKYSFPNGDEYYGTFKDGMFHGSGIYRWGEDDFFGDQYSGQFENNKVHGSGIYTMNDRCNFTGVTHKGVWCNNVFSGKYSGMFDGVLFESEVRDNELNGESKFFFERFILNAQYNNGVLIANITPLLASYTNPPTIIDLLSSLLLSTTKSKNHASSR